VVRNFRSWSVLTDQDVSESFARRSRRKITRTLEQSFTLGDVAVRDQRRYRRVGRHLRRVERTERRVRCLGGEEAALSEPTVARSLEKPARFAKVGAFEVEGSLLAVGAPGLKTSALTNDPLVAGRFARAGVPCKALLLQRLHAPASAPTRENREDDDETEQPGLHEESWRERAGP
jgi:hypothetical protein